MFEIGVREDCTDIVVCQGNVFNRLLYRDGLMWYGITMMKHSKPEVPEGPRYICIYMEVYGGIPLLLRYP